MNYQNYPSPFTRNSSRQYQDIIRHCSSYRRRHRWIQIPYQTISNYHRTVFVPISTYRTSVTSLYWPPSCSPLCAHLISRVLPTTNTRSWLSYRPHPINSLAGGHVLASCKWAPPPFLAFWGACFTNPRQLCFFCSFFRNRANAVQALMAVVKCLLITVSVYFNIQIESWSHDSSLHY